MADDKRLGGASDAPPVFLGLKLVNRVSTILKNSYLGKGFSEYSLPKLAHTPPRSRLEPGAPWAL